MISSKKIDLFAILLTAVVLIGIVFAMFLPKSTITGHSTGTFSYSDNHRVSILDDDYYITYSDSELAKINLKGEYAESTSRNVVINEGAITILGGGVYVLSGELTDGKVIIDSADGAEVRLILNNASITSSDSSAIFVKQAKKTVISLVEGTENTLTDATEYKSNQDDESVLSATLYSKDDLIINGKGMLRVNGNYQDGIKVNDVLKITEGTVIINAVDDGINANDYIVALDVQIDITSGGDAIKCEHEEENKGFIAFEKTSLFITSEGDGICSSSAVYMNNTKTEIVSGGGSENAQMKKGGFGFPGGREFENNTEQSEDSKSTKAIKAVTNIVINNGSFMLDSSDDSIHSDNDLTIEAGTFVISSGDDAVHAGNELILNPESLDIQKCYEGLEGGYITINGGDIKIISNDDGINAVGDGTNGGMGMMRGGMGGEAKTSEEDIWLTVNDGHIYIETSGDGFDSNGSAVINGGFLEIYGPENSGNGSIDVDDGGYVFLMNGGKLLAVGSSGMAEHPLKDSSKQSLTFYLENTYQSGSTIQVNDSSGNEIISGISNKKFNWICMSTETLVENETYTLLIDEKFVSEITANGSFATIGNRSGGMGNRGGMSGLERKQK